MWQTLSKYLVYGTYLGIIGHFLGSPSEANILYVSQLGDNSNGLSWETAFNTIQRALILSSTGDDIWIKGDTYVENLSTNNPVRLIGGFSGDEQSVPFSQQEPTILDGNGMGAVLTLHHSCSIQRVSIRNGKALSGSGIFLEDANLELFECSIISNGGKEASSSAGGISAIGSEIFITDCLFEANRSHFTGALGLSNSTAQIQGTTFSGNDGGYVGGAISAFESTVSIDRCRFEDNITNPNVEPGTIVYFLYGGAIYFVKSDGTVDNSLFATNYSLYGDDIYFDSGNLSIFNCNIFHLHSPTNSIEWSGSVPAVRNSIFYGGGDFFESNSANVTYSNIEGGYPGEGNIDADPLFVDFENGDYHLQRGSPCIDAGTDTGLTTDFDGNPRPIGLYDMGAFEFPFLRSDINGDERVDEMDLLLLQGDWMKTTQ